MTKTVLGKLDVVDLRDVWQKEAGNFTPWLASEENIAILGEVLQLRLKVVDQERRVGPFRADIVCQDLDADAVAACVLIENQLELSDHKHLGQIITYASGLKAGTIVWIASKFTDEHRAAIEWLNRNTAPGIDFFALEIQLWRIGVSPPAPKFNIVSQPNDWSKTRGPTGTDSGALRFDFWSEFKEYLQENGSMFRPSKPSPGHSMTLDRLGSSIRLCAANTLDGNLRVEVVIEGESAETMYERLKLRKSPIETEVGNDLEWHHQQGKTMCRISLWKKEAHSQDRESWPQLFEWLESKAKVLQAVFGPAIKTIEVEQEEG